MPNEPFEIELTAMANGGSALGRHGKKTVFIPYTIPGERVTARITEDKGRVAFAEGMTLVEASADRVYPRCPHFGPNRCGRCQWQHIDYTAQILLKQDVLVDQLSRIGGFDDALLSSAMREIIPSPVEWLYNHHITFETSPEGQIGFPSSDGRSLALIDECHIIHPALFALYRSLDMDFSAMRTLKLQIGSDGEMMMILAVDNEEDAPEIHIDLPISVNLLLEDDEPINLIGETHLRYTVGGRQFRVTGGSAFRSNIAALEKLVEVVVEALALKPNQAVLDLYAGVGFFSAFIADKVRLLTLVESYPPAATDADSNLADFAHIDLIEGRVEDVLSTLDTVYDAVIVDPPAQGLSVEVVDALVAKGIPRLVYVSGDPATLARDAARLVKQGYALASVQPMDLAPQTYYVDAVAVFVR